MNPESDDLIRNLMIDENHCIVSIKYNLQYKSGLKLLLNTVNDYDARLADGDDDLFSILLMTTLISPLTRIPWRAPAKQRRKI